MLIFKHRRLGLEVLRTLEQVEILLFNRTLREIEDALYFNRRLCCVWNLILEQYSDPGFHLGHAASECGISRSRLNVQLQKAVGLSFHRLVNRLRTLKAIELMPKRDYSLVEIGAEVGFEDPVTMRRSFQKRFGSTPREFRTRFLAQYPSSDRRSGSE